MTTNEESNKNKTITTSELDYNEDELRRLNENNSNINRSSKNKKIEKYSIFFRHKCRKILIIILVIMIIFCIIILLILITTLSSINLEEVNNSNTNITLKKEEEISLDNLTLGDRKLTIAFVYSTLYANGIARFITLASNYLIKTGKYNIYIITEKVSSSDYGYDKRINRIIESNRTLLKNKTKDLNIDFFILQNTASRKLIDFYKSIGKFVIGMFHGLYTSAWFHGKISPFRTWISFDNLDAFIFIGYDDYFFYKKLGFKNEIFIPNFYTFEPKRCKESELKGHNIVMLGRAADDIKGIVYAIKSISLIVKEIPDVNLILLSSSNKIDHLKAYAKKLGVDRNINFNYYTQNISKVFWNSSVLMYTSLSEAFPLAMVEGKAHGLPVVAFDVSCSPPYQKGVINVDMLDCEALANETIKLLKDDKYRKKMGRESKLSLKQFNNEETAKLWEKLFVTLMKGDKFFRKLQKEVEKKYYDEDKARKRMEKRFRDLLKLYKNFTCYKLNDFTNINYIRHIKECPLNNTQKIKSSDKKDK